jgi:hypothetical protein
MVTRRSLLKHSILFAGSSLAFAQAENFGHFVGTVQTEVLQL